MSRQDADVRFPAGPSPFNDAIVGEAVPVYAAAQREQPGATTHAHGWKPAMLATLDWLSVGIAVIDANGALLRANPAAAAMLARATHVKIVDGRIVGAHSVASPQWNAVVRSARANSGEQPSLGRVTATDRGELEVLAFAVAGGASAAAAPADVLVVLYEPHPTPASAHDLLQLPNGLTAAEVQLVRANAQFRNRQRSVEPFRA
jgi:hypothetical protein